MINATAELRDSTTDETSLRPFARNLRVRNCDVVLVSDQPVSRPEEGFGADLLPWADPYIASLVAAVQR